MNYLMIFCISLKYEGVSNISIFLNELIKYSNDSLIFINYFPMIGFIKNKFGSKRGPFFVSLKIFSVE